MIRLARLLARFQTMGFEGPFYRGLRGKARFILESVAWRTEFIFAGTQDSLASVPPAPPAPLLIAAISSFAELEIFRTQLEAEYYSGYLDSWRRPFGWGEQVMVGTIDGRIAAFAWVQRGTPEGFPTYYNRLFQGDARILRVGVVPTFRRQGLNSAMMHALLGRLLREGFGRVYAESHKYNVPSVRTFLRVGFRPVGSITVLTVPGEGEFVRWSPFAGVEAHLRELGLSSGPGAKNESPWVESRG